MIPSPGLQYTRRQQIKTRPKLTGLKTLHISSPYFDGFLALLLRERRRASSGLRHWKQRGGDEKEADESSDKYSLVIHLFLVLDWLDLAAFLLR